MRLYVGRGFSVEVIESDLRGPWKVLVKGHFRIWIEIDLKPVQMSFAMKRRVLDMSIRAPDLI